MVRYPIKDEVAIVGIGSTGFTRGSDRSTLSLAVEAGISAGRGSIYLDHIYIVFMCSCMVPAIIVAASQNKRIFVLNFQL